MKTKVIIIRCLLAVMLAAGGGGAVAQQTQDPEQTVCPGPQEYHVDEIPGATFNWVLTGGGIFVTANGNDTIVVDWTTPGGPYTLSVSATVNNCQGPAKSVNVTVAEAPVGPTLANKIPPGMSVCDGSTVSATFNPGTGGVGCSDEFEYSYDNSGTWLTYVPATALPTAGHTLVEIRGRRAGCTPTLGCNETPWVVLASWNILQALPVTVTITASADPVCEGATVTYTAVVQNGGAAPTYEWRISGGPVVGTGPTYTYAPADGDIITCEVVSTEPCASPIPASGTFTPVVIPPPTTSDIWHN